LGRQIKLYGGDDKIKSGKGDDVNCGDNADRLGVCETDGDGGDDKINAGQGDDELTGGGGADKFQCGSGEDSITDYNPDEGDKATGNCEGI
jgi:Ca2+-binding RTX toxin-like protein